MSALLLKTKLFVPESSPHLVVRSRLLEDLNRGRTGKLTLVAAPAGFGKTSVISCWLQECAQAFAWISLDETDNDETIFWAYMVSALQQAWARIDQEYLANFNLDRLPPIPSLLTVLINELAACQGEIVLVLDDYHVISNAAIHEHLRFLIDNLPPQLHVVLSTRADPPLPLARLRAKSQLSELRADDLRFTLPEATTLLNEILELELDPADIATLEERTEGWAAGLQLAALSMRGRQDKNAFITKFSGSHHFVLEYLTEEVIDHLPETQRLFLLQTSVLDSFCAGLCNQVMGIVDSASRLSVLQRSNLFLVPLDDERVWFRYHHLFADLLKNRLQQDFAPQEVLLLYQKASQWYQEQDDLDQAIKYALLAQDHARAADMIEQIVERVIARGQIRTLLGWMGAIPAEVVKARPRLCFYHAWALSLGGQHRKAEQILIEAKSTLESLPNSPENLALRGEAAALLTGIITYSNDPSRVIQEAEEALTYLPDDNRISRARVFVALGTAYAYRDELQQATQNYQQARNLALEAGNPFLAAAAIELLAGMQIYHQGCLREAARNLEEVLVLGRTTGGTYQPFTGTAHILLAETNIEWDRLDTAAKLLETGIGLIQQGGIRYSLTHTNCTKARLKIALGEIESVVAALRAAEAATEVSPLMHISVHNFACQVKSYLSIGALETASRRIEAASANLKYEVPGSLPNYLREAQQIAVAHVFLARGDLDKAIEILDDIHIQAETAGRMKHVIEINLLKALALQELGESEAALKAFEKCLTLAEPEGFIRLFLEAGKPAHRLLQDAASQEICPQYIRELLAAFGEAPGKTNTNRQTPFLQILVEPLTERECEVLKLIAAGYTNQQIADALVVSLNTVKKHTTHIYGKLEVQNRTEASNRARELGLV